MIPKIEPYDFFNVGPKFVVDELNKLIQANNELEERLIKQEELLKELQTAFFGPPIKTGQAGNG